MLGSDASGCVGKQVRITRESRLIRAQLKDQDGLQQDIFVRNLSRLGIGAKASQLAPAKGAKISVQLPGGLEVHGTVQWRSGQHFGVKLDAQLEVATVAEEMRRHLSARVPESTWDMPWLNKIARPNADAAKLRRV